MHIIIKSCSKFVDQKLRGRMMLKTLLPRNLNLVRFLDIKNGDYVLDKYSESVFNSLAKKTRSNLVCTLFQPKRIIMFFLMLTNFVIIGTEVKMLFSSTGRTG